MNKRYIDEREEMPHFNRADNPIKNNDELVAISNRFSNTAFYCDEFIVSHEAMKSLRENGNCVIGTGKSYR